MLRKVMVPDQLFSPSLDCHHYTKFHTITNLVAVNRWGQHVAYCSEDLDRDWQASWGLH